MSEPRQPEPGSYNRMHDIQMEAMRQYRERQQQEQENPGLFEPLPPPIRQLNREIGRPSYNYNELTQPPEGGRRKSKRIKRNRKSKRNNKRSRKSKRRY
jgi:hypothetical protein